MTFPLKEIGNRKIKASSLICVRRKYLKCTFFYTFGCELIAGPLESIFRLGPVAIQSEKRQDVTNMLRTSWTLLVKTLPNIRLMENMVKNIWKILLHEQLF